MQKEIKELIETLGEEIIVDNVSLKALVEFGSDERGFDTKVLTFISFKDDYKKITFRGKEFFINDFFIDEFGVVKVVLGEEDV